LSSRLVFVTWVFAGCLPSRQKPNSGHGPFLCIHGLFHWYDPIRDRVYGSQAFSRKLESYGVEHEAEEYRGIYWTENWTKNGRFYARLLPFFARHLVFQPSH
jgi:hypothetical protein